MNRKFNNGNEIAQNEREIKIGFEFYNELPRAKKKVFRKAFIQARGIWAWERALNHVTSRRMFFLCGFHLFTYAPRDMFYFMARAGKDTLWLHNQMIEELTQIGIDYTKIGYFRSYFEMAERIIINASKSMEHYELASGQVNHETLI